jgi:hypothetical protein
MLILRIIVVFTKSRQGVSEGFDESYGSESEIQPFGRWCRSPIYGVFNINRLSFLMGWLGKLPDRAAAT